MGHKQTAVVLGGYGLIGAACIRALTRAGFHVISVGRSLAKGQRSNPGVDWLARDIATTSVETWAADLAGVNVIVNASGALQTGLRDDLTAIHETAIERLTEAMPKNAKFIQISAAGVSSDASTDFMRTKARGDQVLMESGLDWIILRPTLVIGAQAYGGTALLRASAAMPGIGIDVLPETPVQTVALDDVADAVVQAAQGDIAPKTIADLTESGTQDFATVTNMMRQWLGYSEWRTRLTLPKPLVRVVGRCADALGWLGWRSPFRSTALQALEDGIVGDPTAWIAAGGTPCLSFAETLASIPATTQDRWFARLFLLLPLAIAALSLFWIASGVIGVFQFDEAKQVLMANGLSSGFATTAVGAGAAFDIALGCAVLVRPWARRTCVGMIALSLAYLIGATVWVPGLWLDPLGPLLKVVPTIILVLFVLAILEER